MYGVKGRVLRHTGDQCVSSLHVAQQQSLSNTTILPMLHMPPQLTRRDIGVQWPIETVLFQLMLGLPAQCPETEKWPTALRPVGV